MQSSCPLCHGEDSALVYSCDNLPLFQNVVFETMQEAIETQQARVALRECRQCGFAWNSMFDAALMHYDKNYQNEQGLSKNFNQHLNQVIHLLLNRGYRDKKIVEVGCGKGRFIQKLKQAGFTDIKGYDPAYEGDEENIVAEYFGENSMLENADLIILRHVLEHIARPAEFLKMIAANNRFYGEIYIEVPDFHWIKAHGAFWDIYNEHCNYFTPESLGSLFDNAEPYPLFEGQYIGLFGTLDGLKNGCCGRTFQDSTPSTSDLDKKIQKYDQWLNSIQDKNVIVWGGSSKGVIFTNHLDKGKTRIHCLIDINVKKQDMFIGGTGHIIRSPEYLKQLPKNKTIVLVANGNYFEEIHQMINDPDIELLEIC